MKLSIFNFDESGLHFTKSNFIRFGQMQKMKIFIVRACSSQNSSGSQLWNSVHLISPKWPLVEIIGTHKEEEEEDKENDNYDGTYKNDITAAEKQSCNGFAMANFD